MNRLVKMLACAGAVSFGPSVVAGQGVVMQKALSLGLAKTIAEAALAECKAKGYSTSVVVVDRAGQTLVMLRDEAASAQTLEMARRKAAWTPGAEGVVRAGDKAGPAKVSELPF